MPQMAPISWLSLFIIFSISYMLFNTFNYYMSTPTLSKGPSSKMKSFHTMNWKW